MKICQRPILNRVRRPDPVAAPHDYDAIKHVFDLELSGSSSLNTRGSQLAGLTAVTLALLANFATTWRDKTKWELAGAADVLLVVASATGGGLLLFSIMFCVYAVLPRSGWRQELVFLIKAFDRADAAAERARLLLTMADIQRVTNEGKARCMRSAYVTFGIGIAFVVFGGGVFLFGGRAV